MNKQVFTTVSEAAGRFLVESINCKPENVEVLPNGVDSGRFELSRESRSKARDRFNLRDDDYVIGNVGNFFSAVKGHGTLVKAFALVAPEVTNAKLLLVGVGPLQKDILEQVRSYDLEAHVIFADGVEDVSEVLPAMDVYVCPSDSEGMSNAVLEAMACSLPCVVTDVSDHRQMFSDSDWDCLIEPGDYRDLAGKLRVLADAPQVGRRLGLLARDRVRGEYDYMKVVRRYKRFYETVSGGEGSGSFKTESPQNREYHEAVTEVISAGTDGGVSVV